MTKPPHPPPPRPAPAAEPQVAGTAAFSKFMHLLQLVADAELPPTMAELVRMSGYPRPTVYRTVAALVAERMLAEGAVPGQYQLGPRLIQLASRSWERSRLRQAARDCLVALRDITGETVHLAVPNGLHMVYIDKLESPQAVRMNSRIGANVALHSTAVGKAYLAALDEPHRQALLARMAAPYPGFTPQTVTRAADLQKQLTRVQAGGWAVDEEENEAGIHCFGAAIRDAEGRPVAAVSVSTLRFRQKSDLRAAYVLPLLQACEQIRRQLLKSPDPSFDPLTG